MFDTDLAPKPFNYRKSSDLAELSDSVIETLLEHYAKAHSSRAMVISTSTAAPSHKTRQRSPSRADLTDQGNAGTRVTARALPGPALSARRNPRKSG